MSTCPRQTRTSPVFHPYARTPTVDGPHDAVTRDRRDPIVLQAITNVTDRQPMEGWLGVSPRARTQAIYEEIRRLDLAWVNGTAAPTQGDAGNLAY